MDIASANGKSTGIVTTDSLLGATPSAFSAHSTNRAASEEIFLTQVTSGVNLLCGASDSYCTERSEIIKSNGYVYCDDISMVANTYDANKAYWQIGLGSNSAPIKLHTTTEHALNFLDKDDDGFVLMIEQAHIDKYSHDNNFEKMTKAVSSLNDTVNTVLEWIGDRTDTAVLVTADHETGGLSVSSQEQLNNVYTNENASVYYSWTTTGHTNTNVILFMYGFDYLLTEKDYYNSQNVVKNIFTYNLMKDLLKENTSGTVK